MLLQHNLVSQLYSVFTKSLPSLMILLLFQSLTLPLTQNVVFLDSHTPNTVHIIHFVLQPSQRWRKGIARHQPLESKGLWPLSIVVGGRDRLSAGKAQSKQCIAAAVCEERFPGANTHLKNTSVSPSFFLSPSHF